MALFYFVKNNRRDNKNLEKQYVPKYEFEESDKHKGYEYIYPGEVIIIPKSSINTYVVKEGDTILDILKLSTMDELMDKNDKIYLLPNQLIVYGKE